ncbi:MAG: nicotinate-nicotinamide nucleotide adenylyltransferase, partial [Betaproteobacteria bacterium]
MPLRPLPAPQRVAGPDLDARRGGLSRGTGLALLIPLALVGGTFDPVHYGHLRLADDVSRALDPIEVRLVPAADPPHRDAPAAGAGDRVAMLEIAIREFPALAIDTREIARPGKSYTVDTLSEIRAAM